MAVGVDVVELDLQMTKYRVLIGMHDGTLKWYEMKIWFV
ncbi:MAG: glycerophosphodiester phosphodiesterase family protein [Candidatus Cryptobacteroides sp.]